MAKGKGPHKLSIPDQMPVLPILSVVVFPFAIVQLIVRRDRNINLLRSLKGSNQIIALVAPKNFQNAEPGSKDLHEYGVAAKIVSKEEISEDTFQIALQGLCRIRIKKYTQEDPFLVAEITEVVEKELEDLETKVLLDNLVELFNRFVSENSRYSSEIVRIVEMNLDEGPSVITDLIASYINFKMEEKQHLLETLDVKLRIRKLIDYLGKEIDFLKVEGEIQSKARQEMEKSQREYFLRRQLDEIKKELGEDDQANTDLIELKEKLKKKKFPKETMEVIKKELSRLERLSTVAADYHVIRTYLDWLIELPWEQATEDMLNIHQAKKILDEDHYGLEKVKERILEYLAVLKLKKDLKGPILCFVGPPGVGKTSLGQSIARAMNRKFMRISLGGVKDEAEIRGHRRTYVGALPGRIIQGIKKAGTRNPLFMIDEIDKISGERGDPSSALLEVLDPAQNNTFKDNYIEIPFDLSQVMFITTANLLDPIPEPLKDRMEVIKLSGYTLEEKVIIANDHIIPRQIKEHGLTREKIHFTDEAVKLIVKGYTREAGVRNLEREISHISRKAAKEIAEGSHENFIIKANNLSKYLGPKKMFEDEALQISEIGIAQGLAWNEAGGALLHIETTKIPFFEGIKFTGQLGDVMKESVQAAMSYVQSRSEALGIDPKEFKNYMIHVHFPAASIPKDGPSAGATIATAIASLMSQRAVNKDVAMTGEISLRGHVLPVGGIKEKVLAAYRAGIKTVILPSKNKNDLLDIPNEVKRKITFELVETMDEVFKVALLPARGETEEEREAKKKGVANERSRAG